VPFFVFVSQKNSTVEYSANTSAYKNEPQWRKVAEGDAQQLPCPLINNKE